MARPKKSSRDIYQKYDSKIRAGTSQEISIDGERIEINWNQIVSVVIEAFCRGKTAGEIADYVSETYRLAISREEPYSILSYAGTRGWLKFVPEHHVQYATNMQRMYPLLEKVEVAQTIVPGHVANRAAESLVAIVQKYVLESQKSEVHIGLSGGIMMRKFAEAFADQLCRAPWGMPKRIVFHAMVPGLDTYDLSTDPNSFVSYFMNRYAMQVETRFVGFRAPPFIAVDELPAVKSNSLYQDAFEKAAELDVIVTSGSDCPQHSMLNQAAKRSQKPVVTSENGKLIADFLWRPIGIDGPISEESGYRATTLVELKELPGFIAGDKKVLLLVSPCGGPGCLRPKDQLLRIILEQKLRYISHLVVDNLTAGRFLQNLPKFRVYGGGN